MNIVKVGDYIRIKDNTVGLDRDKRFLSGVVSEIGDGYFMLKTSYDFIRCRLYKISFTSFGEGKRYSLISINGKIVVKDVLDSVKTSLPKPKTVLANYKNGKDYVTVIWEDGTHTVICRNPEDEYDVDKAIMYAALKKICGNNSSEMNRYLRSFHKCHKACRKWNKNYSKKLSKYNKED